MQCTFKAFHEVITACSQAFECHLAWRMCSSSATSMTTSGTPSSSALRPSGDFIISLRTSRYLRAALMHSWPRWHLALQHDMVALVYSMHHCVDITSHMRSHRAILPLFGCTDAHAPGTFASLFHAHAIPANLDYYCLLMQSQASA